MKTTQQEPWLFCEGTDEGRPFIGNRIGFEILRDHIENLLSSDDGIQEVKYENLGFSELRIQKELPEIPPMDMAGKIIICSLLGGILLIIGLALVGLTHLIF